MNVLGWMCLGAAIGVLLALLIVLLVPQDENERHPKSCPLCVAHVAELRIERLCRTGLDTMIRSVVPDVEVLPPGWPRP